MHAPIVDAVGSNGPGGADSLDNTRVLARKRIVSPSSGLREEAAGGRAEVWYGLAAGRGYCGKWEAGGRPNRV